MSNMIIDRQNEDIAIDYLAAQRQLYNEAKKFNGIEIFLSIILPFTLSILQTIFSHNTILSIISQILSIVCMFSSLAIASYISHRKQNAATIQQHFDVYVYQMPWDNKLFGKKNDVSHLVAEKSKKLYAKTGERQKLNDWYTSPVGTVPLEKGIWMCQMENYNWDVSLRKRFKTISIIGVSVFIIAVFGISAIKNESVATLLNRIAFVIPMLQWLIGTIKQINEDISRLKELDNLFNSPNSTDMENLLDIQSVLFEHRKSCFTIPNMFYRLFKDNDEDTAHRTAMMQQNK